MTPEEAGERAAAEARSWMDSVLSREPELGAAEERAWGPPGRAWAWSITVTVMAPVMKEGHESRWVIVAPKELGGTRQFMELEEAVKAVQENVEKVARFVVPLLRWAGRAGFDPHKLADAAIVREVMES